MTDASIQRYWTFHVGLLAGRARIAGFFREMPARFYARGLCSLEGFDLPLTQAGLTDHAA